MLRWIRAGVFTAIVWGAAGASALPQSEPEAGELDEEVRDALDAAYDDWGIAAIEPSRAACLAGGTPAAVARGDFNNDGRPDAALAITAQNTVRLVVVIERVDEGTVIEVDTLGQGVADGYLRVEPRGSPYADARGFEDYFSSDTLAVHRCGQPPTIYLWSGLDFRKQPLPGVPQHPR
jgi:hypothetical protein